MPLSAERVVGLSVLVLACGCLELPPKTVKVVVDIAYRDTGWVTAAAEDGTVCGLIAERLPYLAPGDKLECRWEPAR